MRMSRLYMPTLREVPAEAEVPSHQLLLRAGMIRKSASGIYSFLPLGQRVALHIERIVREEMDRAGAQEIRMSALQPREIWEQSGRWQTFGPEMFTLQDRSARDFCLGPTAEEYFTALVRGEVRSYKQLPLNLYQIQWKYRDEKRPRFGINRAREFLMKDAYSFDRDEEGMRLSYENMWSAYERIFDRIGLDYRIVQGDSGAMGGRVSHEFIALSDIGEGVITFCEECDYAATEEKAQGVRNAEKDRNIDIPREKVHTPGRKTIEDLEEYLQHPASQMMKALAYKIGDERIFVFIPGDRTLNEAKLVSYLQAPEHMLEAMEEKDILACGSIPGYMGPIGLDEHVRCIVDKELTEGAWVCGANEEDMHWLHVVYGRDFQAEVAEDLQMVQEGDLCPLCGKPLHFARGIEVGNIFQLGTKYSEALEAYFLDESGKQAPFVMGSYGVGITRAISAVIEQNHDEKGICWPLSVAPYSVMITIMNIRDEQQMCLADKIESVLQEAGITVLVDDRKERPGVKFNDRDLIGIPLRITVGKRAPEEIVEFSLRQEDDVEELEADAVIKRIVSYLKEAGL